MEDIKFSYMWQDGKNWIEHIWTLDNIEGGDHYDAMSDSPFLKDYNLIARRQFTGLLDKQGKEIYEGDVVKERAQKNYLEIAFTSGCFCVKNKNIHRPMLFAEDLEIIGNIYESPELMED